MNQWVTVLTALTLNVNGLGDRDKWDDLWHNLPHCDILCFQEIHLIEKDEYPFCFMYLNMIFSLQKVLQPKLGFALPLGICLVLVQSSQLLGMVDFWWWTW